ncbi:MAG TPA: dihydroxyacetone kinase subunit DhaL [Acetobacteraceae bacterium]|nr:dihydroxyacetone kinase subunit DhaL [Acetobacteraceae bacterium]
MRIEAAGRRRLIQAVADAVIAQADELTRLDQAIGDGDHGLNMKRGFEAVLADLDAIAVKPLPQALHAVGMALVMKVGGASGPLFGTFFIALGKGLPDQPARAEAEAAFAAAIAAVKSRGKSDVGAKTMLDALVPLLAALREGGDDWRARLPDVADAAAAATAPLQALRGRASFLGPRSIGHVDPGARSVAVMVRAACAA